jgi:murein DD-endopeptidase MepM/ murein hydrolase activator NlpD
MLRRSIVAAAGLALVALAPLSVSAQPTFSLPFPCGQTWTGSTFTSHSPPQAIDFNRPDDEGDAVVASAAGVVEVGDLHHGGYGGLVVIDHGGGWETYSAHLGSIAVGVGEAVARGTVIGTVGDTGNSMGPHLHYEQRLDGRPMRTVFHARETPGRATLLFSTGAC